MYVGYAIVTKSEYEAIYNTLIDFGCRQVFTDDLDKNYKSPPGFKKALSELNPNDILVIERVEHLGTSDSFLIAHLQALVKKKIHLRVLEDNLFLCWDASAHATLLQILQKFQQKKNQAKTLARKQTLSQKGKQAGANSKINPDTREFIKTLLDSKKYTIKEICRRAQISTSTYYNHFHPQKKAVEQKCD